MALSKKAKMVNNVIHIIFSQKLFASKIIMYYINKLLKSEQNKCKRKLKYEDSVTQ